MSSTSTPELYDPARTALILVDPLNDFLGDKGKLTGALKQVGDKVNLLSNLRLGLNSVRAAHSKIFYGTHHRYE